MYTQRLKNLHNALWESVRRMNSRILPEDGARSWIIHSFILEELVHGVIQHRYKLIVNWLLGFIVYIISVTEFKINPSILLLELPVSNEY